MAEGRDTLARASAATRAPRRRILLACLGMSLAAVAALAGSGLGFRYVLHLQARENCLRIADVFATLATRRLSALVSEGQSLAKALAGQAPASSVPQARPDGAARRSVLCSWAMYDPDGQRVGGEQDPSRETVLLSLGVGMPRLPGPERARAAEAQAGGFTLHLAPGPHEVFAVHYLPVRRGQETLGTLQVATEMSDPALRAHDEAAGVRVVLRPILSLAVGPQSVRINGRPHLVAHRPLTYHGRHLGTITAAVDFETEARYEQSALLAIVGMVAASLVVLFVISWQLADIASVPTGPSKLDRAQQPDAALTALKELPGNVLEFLADAVEGMNARTIAHARRVADLACSTARELGWDDLAVKKLRLAALLHDIGEARVDALASAPDDPAARDHPVAAARMLSGLAGCEDIVRAILYHHERYDGTGYPMGARGAAIPDAARIIAIADFYVALMWSASEGPLLAPDEAAAILHQHRGSLLDPVLVDTFLQVVERRPCAPPTSRTPQPAADGESPSLPSLEGINLTKMPS